MKINNNNVYDIWKIIIILFLFIIYLLKKNNEINVCICTIGKLENLYVKEFISHYKNYGIDKIFIYDNNDINGERFENVINDSIENGFVEIINIRGKEKYQMKAFQECLNKNYNIFDWLIFYDMDEFIHLKNFKNIKNYLNQEKLKKCQTIQLNMFFHDDNNLLYYDNRTLFERFTRKVKRPHEALKSILKGNISIKINNIHIINNRLTSCNGFGEFNIKEKTKIHTKNPDFKFNYIDHFCFKSTEEFTKKLIRGSAFYGKNNATKLRKIGWYFDKNSITSKKIDYIENYTKLNLSKYRNQLYSKNPIY